MRTFNSESFLLEFIKITWQRHLINISFDYLIFDYMDKSNDAKTLEEANEPDSRYLNCLRCFLMKHRLGSGLRIFVGRMAGIVATAEAITLIQSRMKTNAFLVH